MDAIEHVPVRRSLGIDLGGASSRTTGYAVIEGGVDRLDRLDRPGFRPRLLRAGLPDPAGSPLAAEAGLVALLDTWRPDVVAIDAPLTLPPCLSCPRSCRGPGASCDLEQARSMWAAGHNPVSQRACEIHVQEEVGERPLPTMQIGVITARAVAFARGLVNRGAAPALMQRGEILEVYPRASLRRLASHDPELRPRDKHEDHSAFRARVLGALSAEVDRLDDFPAALANGHVFDAVIAAYTGWLGPDGLEPPPAGFNLASGWIWVPHAVGRLT